MATKKAKKSPPLPALEAPAAAIVARIDEGVPKGWANLEAATNSEEYYALRLLAFVRGDEWAVVLQRIGGDMPHDPDDAYTAGIHHSVFRTEGRQGTMLRPLPLSLEVPEDRDRRSLSIEGIEIRGPAGPLVCSDAMHEQLDLRPGLITTKIGPPQDSGFVILVRAYLASFPDALWPEISVTQAHVGLAEYQLFLQSTAFEHVVERWKDPTPELVPFTKVPSKSTTYRSLARALAARDPSIFEPGTSNLDWRLWARFPDSAAKKLGGKRRPR